MRSHSARTTPHYSPYAVTGLRGNNQVRIDHNIQGLTVEGEQSIEIALRRMSRSGSGFVLVTTASGYLTGIMTDGDFRRWLIAQPNVDLERRVEEVARREVVLGSLAEPAHVVRARFSPKIRFIPLVDERRHVRAIAWPDAATVDLGIRRIGEGMPCMVVAEVGNNHNGDVGAARELVAASVEAGADCVKFQLRDLQATYSHFALGGSRAQDLGSEYTIDLLQRFQLGPEAIFVLMDYCRELGALPLCTPWDPVAVQHLQTYGVDGFKIASADLTNHPLIQQVAEAGLPLIVSTGMSTEAEIRETISLLETLGSSFALLHCTSSYPAAPESVNLAFMARLRELGGGCPVGYSGHELGYSISLAAVTLGAKVLEKHITLNRSWEGTDHRVSLLPDEFGAMVSGIRDIELAMSPIAPRELNQGERMNRESLAKSIVAASEIRMGDRITRDKIEVKSPGGGLQPNRIPTLLGHRVSRPIAAGDYIFESDLEGAAEVARREFKFRRPWGIPVRFHDFAELVDGVNLDLIEFHLSYRDLEVPVSQLGDFPAGVEIVVHAPELFSGDHILDLATNDASYARQSKYELARVVEVAEALGDVAGQSTRPVRLVVNAGGFSAGGRPRHETSEEMYRNVALRLDELETSGVLFMIQTMPPFPWHFGGRGRHNLFVDHREIATFCAATGRALCLDWSHSMLACTEYGQPFSEFVSSVAPYISHMHVADARGRDGEGLDIGDGDIDFAPSCQLVNDLVPEASFIPEVWQGHQNGGRGFWRALEALDGLL